MPARFQLRQEDVDEFEKHGVVCLRGLLTEEQVEELRRGVASCVRNPSRTSRWVGGEPPKPGVDPTLPENIQGRFFQDFRRWESVPEYRKVGTTSALAEVASQLTKSRTIRLQHVHTLVKEPKLSVCTPWHQDTPFFNFTGNQIVTFWIPLDAAPKESSLEFVNGSHKWPVMIPPALRDNVAECFPVERMSLVPDIEKHRDKFSIASWDVCPTDVVAAHFNVPHGAGGSSNLLRAVGALCCGDDLRLVSANTRDPSDAASPQQSLAPATMIDEKLFPVVYTRPSSRL